MSNSSAAAVSNLGALDAAHHLHPFSDMKKLNATGTRIIERGEGCYIFDNHGKRYLDGFAGLWCVNIGYGRREIADAVLRQMNELPKTATGKIQRAVLRQQGSAGAYDSESTTTD